jgi:hypothetical protein
MNFGIFTVLKMRIIVTGIYGFKTIKVTPPNNLPTPHNNCYLNKTVYSIDVDFAS